MAPKEERELTMRERQSTMEKKIDRMYTAIMGDEAAGVTGMVQKVKRHGDYISRDKKLKWTLTGAFGAANIGFWAWVKSHLGV